MMERSEILTAMSDLKLFGMKAAFDEIITDQRGLMGIHPYALLRILLEHGGRRPPKVDLPIPPSSLHEHCTTEAFDAMMAEIAATWIDYGAIQPVRGLARVLP